MIFKIKQAIRKRRWLRQHTNCDDTRQKCKALAKYLKSFEKN